MSTHETTNFEIMEDALGFDISTDNDHRLAELSAEDIHRVAAALHEHTNSEYFRIPIFRDEVVGVTHVLSPYAATLGSVTHPGSSHIGRSAAELIGGVYQALMSQDRLMLPDGLQYALDFYTFKTPSADLHAKYAPDIVKVLRAYAVLRPLFVGRQVMILPMDAWPKLYAQLRPELVEYLVQSAMLIKAFARNPEPDRLSPPHINRLRSEDFEFYVRWVAAHFGHRVSELAALADTYGLSPVLDEPFVDTVFDAMVRASGSQSHLRGVVSIEQSVMLPFLGGLDVNEFAAMKSSGDLRALAQCLRQIETATESVRDRPIELRKRLAEELTQAAGEIGSTVNASTVLRRGVSAMKAACIGTLVAPAVLTIGGLAVDPFRILLGAAGGAVTGMANAVTDDMLDAQRHQRLRRVFLKLSADVRQDQ